MKGSHSITPSYTVATKANLPSPPTLLTQNKKVRVRSEGIHLRQTQSIAVLSRKVSPEVK